MDFVRSVKCTTCSTLLMLVCAFASSCPPVMAQQKDNCSTVIQALKAAQQIVVGMKRSQVEKLFEEDGGVSFRSETVYAYRKCAMLKIRITFAEVSKSNDQVERSQDTVQKVSEMFVQWPTRD